MIKPMGYLREATFKAMERQMDITIELNNSGSYIDTEALRDNGAPLYIMTEKQFRDQLQAVVNKARLGIPLDFKEDKPNPWGRGIEKSYLKGMYRQYYSAAPQFMSYNDNIEFGYPEIMPQNS